MKQYSILFTNTQPFNLYAVDRKQALDKALDLTRGLLTLKQQKKNLIHCKLAN